MSGMWEGVPVNRPQEFRVILHLERIPTSKHIPESRMRKALSEALHMLEVDIEVFDEGV